MKFEASGADATGPSPAPGITSRIPLPHAPAVACDHPADGAARVSYETAELRDLRIEGARLRVERDKLLETQRRVMELLNAASPDKIIHDLRNVLNERELYRTLADIDSLPD